MLSATSPVSEVILFGQTDRLTDSQINTHCASLKLYFQGLASPCFIFPNFLTRIPALSWKKTISYLQVDGQTVCPHLPPLYIPFHTFCYAASFLRSPPSAQEIHVAVGSSKILPIPFARAPAGEPANFLSAPAPDFFPKRLRLRLLVFFQAAPSPPAPRSQKHPAPAPDYWFSLSKYSFPTN